MTVPAERMKAHIEHRIPLSPQAVKLLRSLKTKRADAKGFVFPGMRADAPLSNMALLALLGRMGREDITVHGFRSTFRDAKPLGVVVPLKRKGARPRAAR